MWSKVKYIITKQNRIIVFPELFQLKNIWKIKKLPYICEVKQKGTKNF
jgi:hypothetical protein